MRESMCVTGDEQWSRLVSETPAEILELHLLKFSAGRIQELAMSILSKVRGDRQLNTVYLG